MANCTICCSDLVVGSMPVELECGHFFHRTCIRQWLMDQTTCPNCRCELNSIEVIAMMDQVAPRETSPSPPAPRRRSRRQRRRLVSPPAPRPRSRSPTPINLDSSSSSEDDLPSLQEVVRNIFNRHPPPPPPSAVERTVPPLRRGSRQMPLPTIDRSETPPYTIHFLPGSAIPLGIQKCPYCEEIINNIDDFFMFTCSHAYHVGCAHELLANRLDWRRFELSLRVRQCPTCLVPSMIDRGRLMDRLDERAAALRAAAFR